MVRRARGFERILVCPGLSHSMLAKKALFFYKVRGQGPTAAKKRVEIQVPR